MEIIPFPKLWISFLFLRNKLNGLKQHIDYLRVSVGRESRHDLAVSSLQGLR